MLRYGIGFLFLLPALWARGERMRFRGPDVLPIALLGIGQFGILIALLNFGLRFIPAARAALIFATFPLLTMLLAAALRRERLTVPKASGVLLTLLGVGIALGAKALAPGPTASHWWGEAAVFTSAAVGAVCSVLYRPYLLRYPTVPVSAFAMLASVAFLALLAAAEGFFSAPLRITAAGWLAVLFIGFSSGVGYFLWLWALGHGTPTRVTAFLALSPIAAALLGAVFLGEGLSAGALLGLAAVVAGLGLAHWGGEAARRGDPPP
jgi:drug/metabolite transporter (DMT)-like permease